MSNQQGSFAHRSSLPFNVLPQYDQSLGQPQQRSYSASHASSQDQQPIVASHINSQWRNMQSYLPDDSNYTWPQQQYGQTHSDPQSTASINSIILGEVSDVLGGRSSNDAPWSIHGSQQQAPQLFDPGQFQTPGSGARTVAPDTRSQQGSFAQHSQDSGYQSQSSHKRSAPSDEIPQHHSDPFLSPSPGAVPRFHSIRSPTSVASDSKIHSKRPRRTGLPIRCPREGCEKVGLKNHSDLQKHLHQHDKPFTCDVLGCEREEGFGTSNDLERHRASVHSLHPRCGTTIGYICAACEQFNSGTNKWWPRKDNFKSHIRRKHSEWDENQLVEISSRNSRPADACTDIHSATSHHGNNEDRMQRDFGWNGTQPYQGDLQLSPPGNEREILAGVGHLASGDSAARDVGAGTLSMPGVPHPNEPGRAGTGNTRSDASRHNPMRHVAGFAPPAFHITGPQSNTHLQEPDDHGWGQQTVISQATSRDMSNTSQSSGGHTCLTCGKVKKRPCDLRKHEKRHTRPYGCTFPRCFRRFGSRNDWKRHENAQHFLNEQWRCGLINLEGAACGKLCYKQEEMSAHLDNRHGNEGYHHDNPLHWDTIDRSHLGHEGHHHFWCGFCNTLVPQPESVHQGNQDPRFQHIGDHFDKHKLTIDDWVDIEENKKKKFIAQPKTSKHARKDSSADESDLGDDGIPDPAAYVAGYTAPVTSSAGYATDLPVRASLYTTNKRLDLDDDADGESDHEYSRRMIG